METPTEDESGLIGSLDAPVAFRPRPRLARAETRIPWRIALLCLDLRNFNRSAASLVNLHILGWGQRSFRSRETFLSMWEGRRYVGDVLTRMDPDLPMVANLSTVHGYVGILNSGRVSLTPTGHELAANITADDDLFVAEKAFLSRLGKLSDAEFRRRFVEST